MIKIHYVDGPFDGSFANLPNDVPPLTITLAQLERTFPTPDFVSAFPVLKHHVYASTGAVDSNGFYEYHYTGTT